MQSILHSDSYKNVHPIMDDIERFYALVSDREYKSNSLLVPTFDECFNQLQYLFNVFGGTRFDFKYVKKPVIRLYLPQFNKRNLIVCHSGGKDSTAAVLHYLKLGYNIHLYHVTGLNKIYYDEYKAVQNIADYLNLPLKIEDVHYKGYHQWTEHPMKNMILANMALNYGIREGIGTKVAFGNFYSSTLYSDPFDVTGGDCKEMWSAYESIIKRIIPRFRIYRPFRNFTTTINTIVKNPEYLPMTISCLTPNRFRKQLREKNQKKYGYPQLPNRCGSCWKCCLEYIVFCDHNILPFDEKYYKHCLQILKYNSKKESNIVYNNIRDLWYDYVFYDIKKSKLFPALQLY